VLETSSKSFFHCEKLLEDITLTQLVSLIHYFWKRWGKNKEEIRKRWKFLRWN